LRRNIALLQWAFITGGFLMNKPQFFVTPGAKKRLFKGIHYSQTVKIGSRVAQADGTY